VPDVSMLPAILQGLFSDHQPGFSILVQALHSLGPNEIIIWLGTVMQ
jgi:hypothetical protein